MFQEFNSLLVQLVPQTSLDVVEVSLLILILFSVIYAISISKKNLSLNTLPLLVFRLKGKNEDFYNTTLINKGFGAARLIRSEPLYMIIKDKKQIFRLDFDVNAINLLACNEEQNVLPLVTKNGEEISLNDLFIAFINSGDDNMKAYPMTLAFKDILGHSYFINYKINTHRLEIFSGPTKYYFSYKFLRLKKYVKSFIIISYNLFIWRLKR